MEYADPAAEWGFQLAYKNLSVNERGVERFPVARPAGPADGLPSKLPVHTALYFDGLTNGGRTIYERDRLPVLVERRLGRGTVLLVADSYAFSNEALVKDRQPGLLAWMIGGGRDIIFDEAHLGVVVEPGVAALLRKYHLQGLLASLLLLAGLFVWKNATSLAPPAEAGVESDPPVTGREAMAGLVNLLRRGIPRAGILDRIYEEWRKTGHRSPLNVKHRREIEALIAEENARPPNQRQPLAAYQAIATLLHRRR